MTRQVLVDAELLERLARYADGLSCAEESAPRKLRDRAAHAAKEARSLLAQPQPCATCRPNPETGDISPERVTSVDTSQPSPSAGEVLERWIPVSERLPEELKSVLVLAKGRPFVGVFYGPQFGWDVGNFVYAFTAVTHWCPLPAPPTSSQNAKTSAPASAEGGAE